MNRVFRLVWSQVTLEWVAVAEVARGHCKSASNKLISAAALTLLSTMNAHAGPLGALVVGGAGTISQSGAVTTIKQSSQNLSLTWKSYNIAPQETVNYVQPSASSIAINRIFDTNGSQILGHLNANGQVFLINPNGVLFGASAQVNVGGLVASTLDLGDVNSQGTTRTFSGSGKGTVENYGQIKAADGGYVALLGNHVSNQGVISAQLGSVALGAGNSVSLSFAGNSLLRMQVDSSVLNSLAENGGLIRADGGQVLMTAGAKNAILASVVNNTGVIQARTVDNQAGTIVLMGGMQKGSVSVGGTLDASAPNGGDGGVINTSAAQVHIASAASISTAAASGKTGTWLIDPLDFTIASSGGDITPTDLSARLNNNNVVIDSANGNSSSADAVGGNINVNNAVTWNANKLTLRANNNININASLSGSGSASLALLYGQASGSTGNLSNYNLNNGAQINLSAGQNFSTQLGSDGAQKAYTVITGLGAAGSITAADLQGMAGNVGNNYALGGNIDASATSSWNANAGFAPIAGLTGTFDGLGHTISNLVINRPGVASVGLIGTAGASSVIQNVGLVRGSTIGGAGTGALVGSAGTGTINNSYATGNVAGAAGTGGLVGTITTGNISNSYSTGNVNNGVAASVGGLLGSGTTGNISNSYTTGSVTGGAGAGGLVGAITSGNITNSYATGAVTGGAGSGGLVGTITTGNITNTYSTGSVFGAAGTGGLVGVGTTGVITNSYATGFISGTGAGRGGLIGSTSAAHVGSFWDTETTGMTTSTGNTGFGVTTAQLQAQANFTSATSANNNNNPAWDFAKTWITYGGLTMPMLRSFLTPLTVTANSLTQTYNGAAHSGASGVSYSSTPTANLQGSLAFGGTALGASNAGAYSINLSGLYSNQQGYLITYVPGVMTINPAPVSIAGVRSYDGSSNLAANIFSLGGLVKGQNLTFSGVGTMADQNVGTAKAVTLGGLTLRDGDNGLSSNYTLAGGTQLVQVNPAPLTISAGSISKTYDGTLSAVGTGAVTTGMLFGTDKLSSTGLAYTDKNVGIDTKIVTASGVNVLDGNAGANYAVSYVSNSTSSITPKTLRVTAQAADKIYDGKTTASVVLSDDRVAGDSLSLSLKPSATSSPTSGSFISVTDASGASTMIVSGASGANFADKNVAADKVVFVSGIQVQGQDAANYAANVTTIASASITPKALTVTAIGKDKVYDGTTSDLVSFGRAGIVFGDNVVLSGTGTFGDTAVGTAKAVAVSGISAAGMDAGNYALKNTTAATNASITPKQITVLAGGTDKVYDGSTSDLVKLSSSGVLTQDIYRVFFTGDAAFANKNVGVAKLVAVTNIAATGSQSGNYTVQNATTSARANITAKTIVVAATGSDKVYDGSLNDAVRLNSNGIVSGDAVNFSSASAVFNDKNVATNKLVTVSGITLSGRDGGNYAANATASTSATITPKSITVTATGGNKVYDATVDAPISLVGSGVIKGDSINFTDVTATFDNKNAGANKLVSVTGISALGPDASNYTLNNTTATANASISQKLITVIATGINKILDKTVNAEVTLKSSGVIAGDTLGFTGMSAKFASSGVGVNKAVTVSGVSTLGADAGNYNIINKNVTTWATITAK